MTRELYDWYKSHGICVRCRIRGAQPGKTRCLLCMSDDADYYEAHKNRRDEAKHREQQKSYYQRRKEAGICPKCGKRKPVSGGVFCGICRAKSRERMRERRIKKGLLTRDLIAHDMCSMCGGVPLEGKRLCAVHYAVVCENLSHVTRPTPSPWREIKRRDIND